VALYEALGWPVPEFAHLSTILGADRERLSKRHGATSIANFRDMGVLPEALVNYLALLGWAPSGGTREIFSEQELIKEFSLERVTASPAVFDMEKLYWLNRHYIKESSLERIAALARPYYARRVGEQPSVEVEAWLDKITAMFTPSVDRLEQLPERADLIFQYEAKAALASPDNAEVLASHHTSAVLARFVVKVLEDESAREKRLTPEQFKKIVSEVKAETGAKGKELFHPIRIAVTGFHSGPEFDKLIPILEEGSRLLPNQVRSVRERVEEFGRALSG
jgi:nondiscriminating glutamyl-tRNA synthetase